MNYFMSKTNKPKSGKKNALINPSEALKEIKDISKSAVSDMKDETARIGESLFDQLLGINISGNVSGELKPGTSVNMQEIFQGKNQKPSPEKKIFFEKQSIEQEKNFIEKRTGELRMQLNAIQEELVVVASQTEELAQETQIAAMQVVVEPGSYHIEFFRKLLDFVKSFRKKIKSAAEWLGNANSRATKKNMWAANSKKLGAKYMFSSEHYVARSAG